MANELASSYISLSVRYASAMSQIARDITGIEKVAKTSGEKAGENLSDGIDKGSRGAGRRVAENVDRELDRNTGERTGFRFGESISNGIRKAIEKNKTKTDFGEKFTSSGLVGAAKNLTLFGVAAGGALTAVGALGPATAALAAGLAAVGAAAGGALIAGLGAMGVAVASIKVATSGLEDTFKLAFDPSKVEDFNKAMAKLGPQTQSMVRAAVGLVQAWKDSGAQTAVQDALFANLGGRLDALKQFISPIRDAMVAVNTAFNGAITSVLDFVNSAQGVGLVNTWLSGAVNIVKNFAAAIGNLVPGLMAVGTAATQVFSPMTNGMADAAKNFSNSLLEMQKNGQLQDFFRRMADTAKQFGAVLMQVGGIIGAVFSAAKAAGSGNAFGGITDKLRELNTFLSQGSGREALITFFRESQNAIKALLPAVMALIQNVGSVLAPIFSNIAQTIAPVLVPAINALGDGLKAAAPQFEGIAKAVAGFIDFITPALPVVAELAPVLLTVVGVVKAFTAAQWLLNAALTANPIGIIVTAIGALVAGLVYAYNHSETFRNVVNAAWTGIKTVISAVWTWLETNVWPALKTAFQVIGDAAIWLWQNAIQPAWEGIKVAIGIAWDLIKGYFDLWTSAYHVIGDAAMWLWNNAIVPAWDGIKTAFSTAWDFISGVFDKLKAGFTTAADFIKSAFNGVADVLKGVFDGIVEVVKAPLHAIGKALQGIGNISVNVPIVGDVNIPLGDFGNKLAGFAVGGVVRGPGTGTSDSILAMLSNGEGVVTAQAMANGGATLVAALNAGWVPPVEMVRSMVGVIPGFAEGLNPGADYLRSQIMKLWPQITSIGGRRSEDGFGEHSSGNAIDVMIPGFDTPQGKALGDAVASFVVANKDALGLDGMIWRQTSFGYGGSWNTGTPMGDRGSPTQNHMDHLHLILGKGRGAGAPAVNMPTSSLSLPSGGSVSPGSARSGGASVKQVSAAQDRVTDLENKVQQSQMALDEARANPKTKGSTLKGKEDALAKNQRELEQAKNDLESLKNQPAALGGKGSGSDSNNPFVQITKGIGQLADLAKNGLVESLLPPGFNNPLDGSLLKSGAGVLNFIGGLTNDPVAKGVLGIASAGLGGKPSDVVNSIGALLPNPFGNTDGTWSPDAFIAAQQHGGTGMAPGPDLSTFAPDPSMAGEGQTVNNDNSIHYAEGGQINQNATQVMDKVQRQQQASQNAQIGTRRFI